MLGLCEGPAKVGTILENYFVWQSPMREHVANSAQVH